MFGDRCAAVTKTGPARDGWLGQDRGAGQRLPPGGHRAEAQRAALGAMLGPAESVASPPDVVYTAGPLSIITW